MIKKKWIVIAIIFIFIIMVGIILINKNKSNFLEKTILEKTSGITVVPTMNDKITADSSWCGTFQLVWNDMKNELVKKDIVFNPQLEMVKNLNKGDFNETMLSEDYYFKIYGLKSLKMKEQIENGIKEKFNQTSDILKDIDWNVDGKTYFFYTMLYRNFEFLQEFDKLDDGKFGNKYENIKYFGIDKNTKENVGNQITVLYYNSKDDFALLINTKTNDEVIFCKNPNGSNFSQIYENMKIKSNKYTGSKSFKKIDEFKAPNLQFNEKRTYNELADKEFEMADHKVAKIQEAIQTIEISLDEKGGKIKSEAAVSSTLESIAPLKEEENKPRYFYVDDTFTIFLREKGKEMPYFAGRIEDITKFQK